MNRPMNASAQAPSSAPAKVLLIDDQAFVAEVLRRRLEAEQDLSIEYCPVTENMCELIRSHQPSVILQDLVLPGTDGITLMSQYRSDPSIAEVPVILLSSSEDPKTKFDAFEAGADDYVVKFPETFELVGRIRRQIRAYRTLQERHELTTQRERIAEELRQRSKLEALGRLAGGVSHELNTPCQYLHTNVSFIRESLEQVLAMISVESEEMTYLRRELPLACGDCLKGIEHMQSIIRGLHALCAPTKGGPVPIQIDRLIGDLLATIAADTRGVADLIYQPAPEPLWVHGSEADLQESFLALMINAKEAIHRRQAAEPALEGRIEVSAAMHHGAVVVEILDNGCGIDEAIRQRLFDPFFTTKDVGQGKGQGLTLARVVVEERCGGTLSVDSTPGCGTRFAMRLPAIVS